MKFARPIPRVWIPGLAMVGMAVSLSPLCGQSLRLDSPGQQIRFDSASGALLEFTDLRTKHNFVTTNSANELWQLKLTSRQGAVALTPRQAKKFGFVAGPGSPSAAMLTWSEFGLSAAPDLQVKAIIRLAQTNAQSHWTLAVENLDGLRLAEVVYPRLSALTPQPEECLAVPDWMGQLAVNARALLSSPGKPRRLENPYPGHTSMQCLAFYRHNGPGLLLACDDTNSFLKNFVFQGDGRGAVGCEVIHLPESDPSTPPRRYALPYSVVLGTFTGDWFTAAEIYRGWATNQWWARESRLTQNTVPTWAQHTALWVWNRGRSEQVLLPARALQKELGLPVSVFWHWWHGCAYDTGFPEYLPPREGAEAFQAALAAAQTQNIYAIVYMNQRLWGMTTASWTNQNAAAFAVKRSDGRIQPEIYNTFTQQPCASMCLATEFWRNTYAHLAERALTELGVNGIYMDQACSSLACYDATHGHSPGGGTYWVNGFRQLAADIRARVKTHPAALAGEGVGEAWLPYLDLMLSLQVSRERYSAPDGWEPIPFFHAVYHPHAIFFGNYSSLTMPPYDELWPVEFAPREPLALLDRKFSRQFLLEQARAFVWGQQPTLANFQTEQLTARAPEIAFALLLARLRQRATAYLLHGTMLRPITLPTTPVETDFSRLSIYAGQQDDFQVFRKTQAPILSAAWRAPNGDVAIALANVGDATVSLPLNWKDRIDEIPARGNIYRLDRTGRAQLARFRRPTSAVEIQLPAQSACIVEWAQN